MKNIKSIFVAGILAASLVGCVSTPPLEEMSQLNGEQVQDLVVGNTWTLKREYGRWAEYIGEDMTGVGKAWGSWGNEKGASTYTVSGGGEFCATYSGEHKWTKPDYEYCSVVLVDSSGKYFQKVIKNPYKPERVGKVNGFEIKPGNHYDLSM